MARVGNLIMSLEVNESCLLFPQMQRESLYPEFPQGDNNNIGYEFDSFTPDP